MFGYCSEPTACQRRLEIAGRELHGTRGDQLLEGAARWEQERMVKGPAGLHESLFYRDNTWPFKIGSSSTERA